MTPKLIPFKAEHLLMFMDRDGGRYDLRGAIVKEKNPAFTAVIENDTIIGCAGVVITEPGTGGAWTVFSKEAEPYMLWCTRIIKKMLKDIARACGLHRIELTVLQGLHNYTRWATFLGFTTEENGIARFYTRNKENIIRMEMIL